MTLGRRRLHGAGACLLAAMASLVAVSCSTRQPAPRTVDGVVYGTTAQPFRQRWWHYYERGVSWARGGFWDEAEADFRSCLATRAADARHARTYGMHFVQCFVHRELAEVLIERGRLDDAERELTLSVRQEPSAKAEHLLRRIAGLRATGRGEVAPVPAPLAPELAMAAPTSLTLDTVTAEPAGHTVAGHVDGMLADRLWAVSAGTIAREVPVRSDGSFTATIASGETLVAGQRQDSAEATTLSIAAAPAPSLTLDGPADGRVITGRAVYYRYEAAADAGIKSLTVSSDARELAHIDLAGVRGGGMLTLPLDPGAHHLAFVLIGDDGRSATERRTLSVMPEPAHDRRLRATALLIPLQAPIDSAPMIRDDDARFADAVTRDRRFRLVDQRAESVITETLGLVEAGYVDPATAAKLGRKLQSRYALTGTLRRGRGDIECFVRLIHVESGREVAAADAYAPVAGGDKDGEFFAFVAARLRQVFPVLQGSLTPEPGGARIDLGDRHGIVPGMRFHVVHRDQDILDSGSGQVLLAGEARIASTWEVVATHADHGDAVRIAGTALSSDESAVSE